MAGDMRFDLLLAVVDKATAPLRAIGSAFQVAAKAGESLGKLSSSLHDARENIQDFADRGTAALKSLTEPAAEVEQALLQLRPVAELAGSEAAGMLAKVRTESEAYSQAHSTQAAAYVEAATAMMRITQDQGRALTGTNVALRLATATTTDAKGAVAGLYALYGVAGDKTADWGSELTRLSDVLTRASQVYGDAINVAEISDPLKDASAAARDAKVPVEQLVGALGAFGQAGIKGGEGGAAVANVITGLQAAAQPLGVELIKTASGGLDLVKSLGAITAKYGDLRDASPQALAAMQQAFGPAWRDVSMLLGQTDKLAVQWGQIGNSAGAAAAGQAAAEATMSGQLAKLDNQLNSVKVTLGTSIMNAVAALAPTLIQIVKPMAEFASAHPQLTAIAGTVAVLTVGAANLIAPVVSLASAVVGFGASALTASGGIGAAATASWAWAAALLANPITWIVLAVIAAVALIYIYWEPITKFFKKLWAQIKEAFSGTWDTLVAVWGAVVGWFTGLWKGIKEAFGRSFIEGVWKVFTLLSPLSWLVKLWGVVLPWLAGLWLRICSAAWDGLKAMGSAVAQVFSDLWQSIKDAFGQGILQGLGRLFELFSPVAWLWKWWNTVTQWLFGLSMTEIGAKLLDSLLQGMMSVGSTIDGWLNSLGAALMGALTSVGQTLWSGISNDLQRVWDFISTFSLVEAGANIVNTIVEGIKSAASGPAEAMADVVARVRAYLPFSPAKVGPLRDLNKVKLVETVAGAVHPEPLVDAMSGVAGAAFDAMRAMPVPELQVASVLGAANDNAAGSSSSVAQLLSELVKTMPMNQVVPMASGIGPLSVPPVAAMPQSIVNRSNSASSATSSMQVTFQVNGSSEPQSVVDELERWIRDPSNARRLAQAVRSHETREQRKEFS